MPKRPDNSAVTDGFSFDGDATITSDAAVTSILPAEDNKVDLGSASKRFKNIYWASLTPDPGTAYLPLAGGTMSGEIKLATNNLTNVGSISGASKTRTADNILSCATDGVSGNLATFTGTSKVVQDSGTALSSLATTASVSTNYLAKSGGTMSGSVNMGQQELTNCSAFRISTANQKTVVGSSTTASGSNYTSQLGGVNVIDASSQSATSLGYGHDVKTSNNAVLVGNLNAANAAINSIVLGSSSTSSANNAHVIGSSVTNSTANSLLLDASANLRSNSTTCDLGSVAKPFQTLYLNTGISGPLGTPSSGTLTNCTLTGATARGQPLTLSKLTQYEGWSAASTSAATSFINANAVGSQIYAANTTNTGMIVRVKAIAQLNNFSGGGTLNISLYLNGASYVALLVPSTTSGYLQAEFTLTLRTGILSRAQGMLLQSGQSAVIADSGALNWDKTAANTVDVRFTFSVASASNAISPLSVAIESIYQT